MKNSEFQELGRRASFVDRARVISGWISYFSAMTYTPLVVRSPFARLEIAARMGAEDCPDVLIAELFEPGLLNGKTLTFLSDCWA